MLHHRLFFTITAILQFISLYAQNDTGNTITVIQLIEKIAIDSAIVILDVRTPEELEGLLGKLNNVINVPVQELEGRLSELEKFKDSEIAVICRTGRRSATATEILIRNGFNARNVLGGMVEFREVEKNNKKH